MDQHADGLFPLPESGREWAREWALASVAFAALNVIIGFVGAPEPDGVRGGPMWMLWVASALVMFAFFALSIAAGLYHLRAYDTGDASVKRGYEQDLIMWWVGAALAIGVVLGAGLIFA